MACENQLSSCVCNSVPILITITVMACEYQLSPCVCNAVTIIITITAMACDYQLSPCVCNAVTIIITITAMACEYQLSPCVCNAVPILITTPVMAYESCALAYTVFPCIIVLVHERLRTEVLRTSSGSNSWPPDHDSTFQVTETPALTTHHQWLMPGDLCHGKLILSNWLSLQI